MGRKISFCASGTPSARKVLKRRTEVAFVGPSIMKREPAKNGPMMVAIAEPKIPY